MIATAQTITQNKITTTKTKKGLQIQRKCSCGSNAKLSGQCTLCQKNNFLGVQTKLRVGAADDVYEQEADRVADQVMAMPTNSDIGRVLPRIQRFTSQPKRRLDSAPASVDRVLASSGKPLEPVFRQDMEQRFNHDFSQVRVHSDLAAEQSTRDISARAYTAGSNVVFGAGQFAPRTHQGRRLIAHELTHVVQQSGAGNSLAVQNDEKQGLSQKMLPIIQRSTGAIVGGTLLGAGAGALVGGLLGGGLGAVIGGVIGAGIGALVGILAGRKRAKLSVAATLRKAAESLIKIGGTADASDKKVVVDELIKVPLIALAALKKKGIKVVVCRSSVTEIRTDLKGVRPRGWPPGKTWDTVPGLYDPGSKRVIIATRGGKVPATGDGHGAVNLVLHEVGHAIGDAVATGGISDPAFVVARNADKAALDTYEGQPGNAGVQETYAESFARFYANDPNDASTYPHLHAYWASNPFVSSSE